MKLRLSASLLLACCMTFLFASGQTKPLTIIKGKVDKEYASKIFIYQVTEGEMQEYASIRLDAGKSYAFALSEIKEGFYYLGDNLKAKPVYYRFYLKGGESLAINISETGYDIIGNSPENKILDQWEKLYAEIANPSNQYWNTENTYVTFFPILNSIIPKAAAFRKKINTPNKKFNSLLSFVIDNDIEFAAINFLYTPRSAHPAKEEYPEYYSTIIKKGNYCDTRVLKLGNAMSRMDRFTLFYNQNSGIQIKPGENFKTAISAICNDTLKGMYAVNNLGRYKTLDNLRTAVEPLKKYFVTDSIKAKYLRYESALATYGKGEKGFNFSYPDKNGDTVSLASLKGKIVLVDTWATWCMPCRVEIPHLKKLEEELKDKAIAFVSLSLDVAKDEDKWRTFVEKEALGGIQLYGKGFSEFAQYYKINSIPRFLIFDKEGKIVTIDSPRPSDPALKELLLKLLEG